MGGELGLIHLHGLAGAPDERAEVGDGLDLPPWDRQAGRLKVRAMGDGTGKACRYLPGNFRYTPKFWRLHSLGKLLSW